MKSFLEFNDIRIGSWWSAADRGKYGCVVISKNEKTKDVEVLYTSGDYGLIDYWKLQYRYYETTPNS